MLEEVRYKVRTEGHLLEGSDRYMLLATVLGRFAYLSHNH